MSDPYDLQRFVEAQDPVFDQVCAELRAGQKRSHWMWFIFPQIRGLGHSNMAAKFAISSFKEAEAYLNHPVLGPRLKQCCKLVYDIERRSAHQIFGYQDDLKFRSSLTLFASTNAESTIFNNLLHKYFDGKPDPLTLDLLREIETH